MNNSEQVLLRMPLLDLGAPGPAGATVNPGREAPWFVESGAVDVFMLAEAGASRVHLFSVGAGDLLLFPAPDHACGQSLVAVPAPGTCYRIVPRQLLIENLARFESGAAVAELIDTITAHLAGALHERSPQGVALAPGAVLASPHQSSMVIPAAGAVWAELITGQAMYAGRLALQPAHPFPLPANSWLGLAADSQVQAMSTQEAVSRLPGAVLLAGVEMLFALVFKAAVERREIAEAEELKRLERKSVIGSRVMSDALDSLAATFAGDESERPGESSGNHLIAACRLVGKPLGITFQEAPPAGTGAGRRDMVKAIAQASGVRVRVVALKGEWWNADNGPLLAIRHEDGMPLALLPQRSGGYVAIDPSVGQQVAVDQELAEALRPFASTFYAVLPGGKLGLSDVLRFALRGLGRDIVTVAAIALASAVLGMAIPLASGHLFDNVFPAADRSQMVQIVAVLFIASLVTLLFEATRALAMLRIEGKAGSGLQAAVWDRVLSLPVPFFRDYSAGDLATRINGINEIRQTLSGTVISSLVTSLFATLNIFLLFYFSVRMGIIALVLVTVAMAVNLTLGYFSVRLMRQGAEVNGRVAGLVLEYLNGITKLRITGSESRAFANWAAGFAQQKRLALRAGALANVSAVFGACFPVAASAVIFACIAMMLVQGEAAPMTTGSFIAFSAAWTIFLGAALSLVRIGIDLLGVASLYERTKPILEAVPEVDENRRYPGELEGAIELSNVSFSYAPDTPLILNDVTMSIKAGEFVALVGSSGSGKSTLLRLMLGFEQPGHGGIYFDGHNLGEVDLGAVRRQLGVVLQGGRLMSGDIFSNIVGSTNLVLDDAWAAAKACGLDQDINAMPMGMHSLVSDGGGTLSGGQRQRLLIARAIVNKPKIIFFDEATSALDNQTQAVVSASMEALKATRVVIAHRLSTIINADRIFVLDKGTIVQCGSYDQLINQPGLFAELAKRQLA